jgi:hypothetical protein
LSSSKSVEASFSCPLNGQQPAPVSATSSSIHSTVLQTGVELVDVLQAVQA